MPLVDVVLGDPSDSLWVDFGVCDASDGGRGGHRGGGDLLARGISGDRPRVPALRGAKPAVVRNERGDR